MTTEEAAEYDRITKSAKQLEFAVDTQTGRIIVTCGSEEYATEKSVFNIKVPKDPG